MTKWACVFASLFILPATIYAQDETDLFSLSLAELMQLEVTGSTLTPQALNTVPSAVTVFNQAQIARLGLDTLNELMNLVPGFQSYRAAQSSHQEHYSSRGRRIGSSASEVLLVMDGQRLNSSRSGGAAIVIQRIPLKNIERVEFIRGPGSAIYGSSAMLGVVNIVSRDGVNEAQFLTGSYEHWQLDTSVSHESEDFNLDLYVHSQADQGDRYTVPDTFSSNKVTIEDPREMEHINFKLQWQNTQLSFINFKSQNKGFYVQNNTSNDINQNKTQFDSISIQQDFNWLSVDSFMWLGYQESGFEFSAQITAQGDLSANSSPSSSDPLFINVDFSSPSETRALWHNNWVIDKHSSLQFGIEHRKLEVPQITAANNFDLGELASASFPISYYGELAATTVVQKSGSQNVNGIYAQYQGSLLQGTHLTLGLRYDKFEGLDSNLSPRFGLVKKLNQHHSVKLLYGEAFRAPTIGELGLTNNPILDGNPELKPESVQTLDIIWLGNWSNTTFTLGYFENHFTDGIHQIPTGVGSTLQYRNSDSEVGKGIEFEFSQEVSEHWMVRISESYFLETTNESFREAEQMSSFMVNYQQFPLNLNLFVVYHGERINPTTDASGENKLDDNFLVNGKLSYLYRPQLQLLFQVKNVLDESYFSPVRSARDANVDGTPNRGREISLGVNWVF